MVTSVRAVGNTTSYTLRKRATEAGTWSGAIANDTIPSWLYVEIEIDGTLYYPDGCEDGGAGDSLNDEYLWSSPTWFGITTFNYAVDTCGRPWPKGGATAIAVATIDSSGRCAPMACA